jgi:hypothetical protein
VPSNSDSWYAQIDLFGAKLTASGQTAAATQAVIACEAMLCMNYSA